MLAAAFAAITALQLSSSLLTVVVDDVFPRPLNYTHASGETLQAALTGWDFHTEITFNKGQIFCGEAGIATSFSSVTASTAAFTSTAVCMLAYLSPGMSSSQSTLTVQLLGIVAVVDDPAVANAGLFVFNLTSVDVLPAPIPGLVLTTMDVVGMEMASFRPGPPSPSCMYNPTMSGQVPTCGGEAYYVDSWSNDGIDEWWSGTWGSSIVQGQVDMNTVAGTNAACLDGTSSRRALGPMASVIAGGWTKSAKTGISVISSEKHSPFRTGLRSYDTPGRCSVFTVAPSPIHLSYLCGTGLPYTLSVGVFTDVTQDGAVDADDVNLWRRFQYPRADVLYRTSLPYKIQVDMTSYTSGHDQSRMPYVGVLGYVANISAITDAYPQTPILVGWQGLGHDTLYPGWDVLNLHPDVGGEAGLQALAQGFMVAARNNYSSLSYHVNADEAYSLFNGTSNPEWITSMCRVNVDHVTPWALNCTALDVQTPDCGLRCSISKTKDNVLYGRYTRYARFFETVPQVPALRTIHSDAWRDAGASWEPEAPSGLGFIDWANEERCGQQADSAFWASHGMSMGVEGNDGQAGELMGTVSFLYHTGGDVDGWSTQHWGRLVSGTDLGWDLDVSCNNPGWLCSWSDMADAFYTSAKIYQLALTDELLNTPKRSSDGQPPVYRFANGGSMLVDHVMGYRQRAFRASDVPHPSTWPYGGDSIPVLDGKGGALLPLVLPDGSNLDPNILHAYQHSNGPMPDSGCPLYIPNASSYLYSDDTAVANWNGEGPDAPYDSFEGPAPPAPQQPFYALCNSTCWANSSCVGWDVIKVTGNSGHTTPECMLFDVVTGCQSDPNQIAGVKRPLPPPPPPTGVTQYWTLPLSWVGASVAAVSITPHGLVPDTPSVLVNGRNLTLVGVIPGWPVRLQRQGP